MGRGNSNNNSNSRGSSIREREREEDGEFDLIFYYHPVCGRIKIEIDKENWFEEYMYDREEEVKNKALNKYRHLGSHFLPEMEKSRYYTTLDVLLSVHSPALSSLHSSKASNLSNERNNFITRKSTDLEKERISESKNERKSELKGKRNESERKTGTAKFLHLCLTSTSLTFVSGIYGLKKIIYVVSLASFLSFQRIGDFSLLFKTVSKEYHLNFFQKEDCQLLESIILFHTNAKAL